MQLAAAQVPPHTILSQSQVKLVSFRKDRLKNIRISCKSKIYIQYGYDSWASKILLYSYPPQKMVLKETKTIAETKFFI